MISASIIVLWVVVYGGFCICAGMAIQERRARRLSIQDEQSHRAVVDAEWQRENRVRLSQEFQAAARVNVTMHQPDRSLN
jgi:hypothetical protein